MVRAAVLTVSIEECSKLFDLFLDEKGGIVETPLEDMEGEVEREKNHR